MAHDPAHIRTRHIVVSALLLAGIMSDARAQERDPGSWVVLQEEDGLAQGAAPCESAPPPDPAQHTVSLCQSDAPPVSGLKFRVDLLPEINASLAEQRRREAMYDARRRAAAARMIRQPILSANADMPFTYSFSASEEGLDNRYTRDQIEARGNVSFAGYMVEASLAESSYATISGSNRSSKLRVEAPFTLGPIRLTTGVDTYSVRDTTAGAAARRIGHGIDLKMAASIADNVDGELSGKVERVKNGATTINSMASGTLHYRFGVGEWQGRLSPGVDVSQSSGPSTPASMAVRLGVAMTRGPQNLELSQRLYRQQIAGTGIVGEDHQTAVNYRYTWPRSSIGLRGSHTTNINDESGRSENWQLGAVWTLKLDALADYLQ